MQDKGGSLKGKYPELYKTEPSGLNRLEFLKTEPFKRSNFHWYSNPVIKQGPHVTDPSRAKGKVSWGKSVHKGSYPF